MGRGKLLKSKVREAKALKKADLAAQLEFKKSNKGLEFSAREHLGKLIDRIDPFESIAIIGLTVIIKNTIDTVGELKERVQGMFKLTPTELGKLFGVPGFDLLGAPSKEIFGMPEWQEWFISFALAYILIKHAGAIFGMLDKGLASIIGLLLI